MELYRELWQEMKSGKRYQNPIYELIKRYQSDFKDSEDTIVIIDEIQESADIYNRIREFTRTLKCDFIITGSYLGRILDFKAKISGIINENFIYLDLRHRIAHPSEIALDTPAFATLGNGEIDFYVKELSSEKTYAIEVKSGKNSGKTDNTFTIPIYGISRFKF